MQLTAERRQPSADSHVFSALWHSALILCDSFSVKSQSQRDLQRHWADQSKKLTPAERLAMKAEKLRKQIERDKALLERRRKQGQSEPQPAGQAAPATPPESKGKSSNSKPATPPRRKAKG
jgi:hypothetical protein